MAQLFWILMSYVPVKLHAFYQASQDNQYGTLLISSLSGAVEWRQLSARDGYGPEYREIHARTQRLEAKLQYSVQPPKSPSWKSRLGDKGGPTHLYIII